MRKALQKQRDASDCGAACLASVASFYGLRIPVSRVRQLAGTDQRGTSLFGLMEAARKMGFQAKGIKTSPANIDGIPFPAIFHLNLESGFQHFVVVYRVRAGRVYYMDPVRGRIVRRQAAIFEAAWTGVVLVLLPDSDFKKGNLRIPPFKRLQMLIRPHRTLLLFALAGALVYTILGLAASVGIEKIVDHIIPGRNRKLLNELGLILIVILIVQVLTGYFKSILALKAGQEIDRRLILGYYRHLMNLPQLFFDNMRVGEIISRVNDAVKIRVFISDTVLYLAVQALTVIVSLLTMFLYCWKLALLMVGIIPAYFGLYLISNSVNARWQRKIMESGASLESHLVESIRGMATIRRFCLGDHFSNLTERKFIPLMQAVYQSGKAGLRTNSTTEFHSRLVGIAALWVGVYFVFGGGLSSGELLSFYTLTGYFTMPVQALIGANKNMQDALIATDRLFEIIDLEAEQNDANAIDELPSGNIEFRNIHFSHGGWHTVFEGLCLTIDHRRITGILGESGSGKSTLFSLLQRIYPLNAGRILFGETDIQVIKRTLLCSRVLVVPQQTDLFQGSLISNIALGAERPDHRHIFELCQRLGLHEFIMRLPDQYHTVIGEQGINLSGGQRQRIAIARAIYRDPEILILDEATASLDTESEQKVLDTLQWFYRGQKTIVLITHRLSAVKECHSILVLKGGRLAARGTYNELIGQLGSYCN